MMQVKATVVAIVALIVGLGAGFVLRPVIAPTFAPVGATSAITPAVAVEPRSEQYFSVHIDEARRIMSGCRDDSVRGEECANAEQAVTEAEGRDRFKKFMGH